VENLPLPGSGVVGGSGVVNLLLRDSSFWSALVCPLRLDCFLRELRSTELLRVLLLFRFFGRSIFSVTLTVFPLSISSSEDGSYDLLDTSCSSLLVLDREMVRYFGLEEDTRLLVAGDVVVLLLRSFVLNLRITALLEGRFFFRLSVDFVLSFVLLYDTTREPLSLPTATRANKLYATNSTSFYKRACLPIIRE